MNDLKQFEREPDTPLSQIGAEELAGSGFENEIPDPDFTEIKIPDGQAGRK